VGCEVVVNAKGRDLLADRFAAPFGPAVAVAGERPPVRELAYLGSHPLTW
jgi:hypothetical protein